MSTTQVKKRRCKACKKLFIPRHDTNTVRQLVCSNGCCVTYYSKQKPKSRKLAREISRMVGKRSMGEVKLGVMFDDIDVVVEYEPDSFTYTVEETRTYTPDFKVVRKCGKVFYVEFKGVLTLEDRKKAVRVQKQYPDLDLRFIFMKASNKIRKGSPTTYGMWATNNGFNWADNKIPKRWLK